VSSFVASLAQVLQYNLVGEKMVSSVQHDLMSDRDDGG